MKQRTLQEQYNLLKEGKGNAEVFMKSAKRQFPNLIRNAATLNETISSLKHGHIITENVWGVVTENPSQPDWFKIFNENMETIAEEAKAVEKKTSKEVEEVQAKGYNYADKDNIDNLNGAQFLKGFYAEMKDPKNAEKTVEEIKEIVAKNLAKDELHYVKDGQFGVKGVGYSTDHPGLGEPKEPKGKWKSSGYGDLKEGINPDTGKDEQAEWEEKAKRKSREEGVVVHLDYLGNGEWELNDFYDADYTVASYENGRKLNENLTEGKKKETPDSKLSEIEKQGKIVTLEAQLEALEEIIEAKKQRIEMVSEDENLSELIDKAKIKELQKEIKLLEKKKAGIEKMYEKMTGTKKKEIVDEVDINPEADEISDEDLEAAGDYLDSITKNTGEISEAMKMNKHELIDKVVALIAKDKGKSKYEVDTYETLLRVADIVVKNCSIPDVVGQMKT